MSRAPRRAAHPTRGAPFRRVAAVAAAAVAVLLGAAQAIVSTPGARPSLALTARLAPLVSAPLPPGSAVALALPPSESGEAARGALYEAAWQRPDLRWTLAVADASVAFVVATPGAVAPPGAVRFWRRGDLVLLRRLAR